MSRTPAILLPYDPAEAIDIPEAALRAGRCARTVRNWCADHQIGRRIAGRWAVSAVALDMLLASDDAGLQAYLAGERSADRVLSYYRRRSIPLPSDPPLTHAGISGSSDFAVATSGLSRPNDPQGSSSAHAIRVHSALPRQNTFARPAGPA